MKKTMTSAAANKMIKKLNNDKNYLLVYESKASIFFEVDGQAGEPAEYDYAKLNAELDELDIKIAKLKHAVNFFNTTTKLKDSELTIDEALVRMAQLNNKKEKLDGLRKRIPKQRKADRFGQSTLVEYECINYDIEEVKKDYEIVEDEIAELQMKIDYVNQTQTFTVDL